MYFFRFSIQVFELSVDVGALTSPLTTCSAPCYLSRPLLLLLLLKVGDEIEEVYVTATAFDPEAKEADDYDTANTHLKFKVRKLLRCASIRRALLLVGQVWWL